jgi:Uma2 family endonuclease
MQPARFIPRYTYNDYLLWEGDWELIDGVPHAMSPSPVRKHQWFASLLTSEILIAIRENKDQCGNCIIVQDVDWIISDDTVVRPDISVICHETEDFITSPPALIVEILSPSTAHKDRLVKHEIYEEQGVKYYIIADHTLRTYTAYHLADKKYQEYHSDVFEIHAGCEITVDITKVLAEMRA